MEVMKGFKVFNPDWTCRGFQYEVGQTYEENVTPSVCYRGFHFCKQAKDCFNYYQFNINNKVAEVRRNVIRSIPNFDAAKFYEITGIRV